MEPLVRRVAASWRSRCRSDVGGKTMATKHQERTERPRRRTFKCVTGTVVAVCGVAAAVDATRVLGAAPTPSFHIEEATIANIQAALETKQVTTVELVNHYLARI